MWFYNVSYVFGAVYMFLVFFMAVQAKRQTSGTRANEYEGMPEPHKHVKFLVYTRRIPDS